MKVNTNSFQYSLVYYKDQSNSILSIQNLTFLSIRGNKEFEALGDPDFVCHWTKSKLKLICEFFQQFLIE